MVSLSSNLNDMPGLTPLMDVLFLGRRDFQISFSNRDNARLKSSLRKFYGRYGNIVKQYEVPLSQILNDIL